jgi:hypothetical protein
MANEVSKLQPSPSKAAQIATFAIGVLQPTID